MLFTSVLDSSASESDLRDLPRRVSWPTAAWWVSGSVTLTILPLRRPEDLVCLPSF